MTEGTNCMTNKSKHLQKMSVHCVSYPHLAVRGMTNAMAAFNDMLAGDEPIDCPNLRVNSNKLSALAGVNELDRMDDKYSVAKTLDHAAE
jgi:2-methylisocitrate lyase-like PEP mutase family enzyme